MIGVSRLSLEPAGYRWMLWVVYETLNGQGYGITLVRQPERHNPP